MAIKTETVSRNGDVFSYLITDYDANMMNCDSSRRTIDRIYIHHNGGTSDQGARSTWYVSTGRGTSAHYQITPTKIWGCVGENYTAYHAGNYVENQRSIGIEHLNNTGAPFWTIAEETYKNSAKLIAEICVRRGIPIDRAHIKGHKEASATACPGGIDVDKLVRMAKEIATGKVVATAKVATAAVKKTVKQVYRADEVKFVNGIYQIRCNDLAPTHFDWTDNGIPVALVNWVNADGSNITDGADKDFKAGMYFSFEGDEAHITDTGQGGYNYGYYWRKFTFGQYGTVWLSAWNKNHLVNK